jgi:MFS family permease
MARWPVSGVALACFVVVFSTYGTRPLVPLYAASLGIGASEIGMIVALYAFLPLLLATSMGRLIDAHGPRRAMVRAILGCAVGLVLPFLVEGRAGLFASQLIGGAGFTAFILAAPQQLTAGAETAWDRERGVAVFAMTIALGAFAGPLAAGWLADTLDYRLAFVVMAVSVLAALPPVLWQTAPSLATAERTARAQPFANPLRVFGYHRYMGRAFLISSLILLAKDMYVAYFPLFAQGLGLTATTIGAIVAVHNGGGVIVRLFQLPMLRRIGKNPAIIGSVLVSGALFWLLPLTSDTGLLMALSLMLGIGLGVGQPLSLSTVMSLAPQDRLGEVLGVRLTCNRLTQVLTPLAFGGIVLVTGVGGTFWVIGAILCLFGLRLHVPENAAMREPGLAAGPPSAASRRSP